MIKKSYKTISIGEVIVGVEISSTTKTLRIDGAAPIGLLIIDNLKPKGTSPTAADGISKHSTIVIFVIVIFLPTLVTSVAPWATPFNKVIVGDQSGKPIGVAIPETPTKLESMFFRSGPAPTVLAWNTKLLDGIILNDFVLFSFFSRDRCRRSPCSLHFLARI